MTRKTTMMIAASALCMGVSGITAQAAGLGAVSTDRFGYDGTVRRYDTLVNAQNDDGVTGLVETISIVDRDLALYIVDQDPTYDTDYNVITGSWWYTTEDNTNSYPKDDPAGDRYYSGYGNTHGNTGIGFAQLYDGDGSTDTSVSMAFGNYDGTYYTDYSLNLTGVNADYSNDYARLSPFSSNVDDKGTYLSYSLSLVATGLEGTETSPGVIESFNHPTGVTGTYTGLFENTTASANAGFYVFDLNINTNNWAFAQGDAALNGDFYDSYFATVPEPASLSLLGLGGLMALKRRKM